MSTADATTIARTAWQRRREQAPGWRPPAVPTLVVAPHPDDEVLMFGGLIAQQLDRGVPVTVVSVTDGGAGDGGRLSPGELARHRRREQTTAVARLASSNGRSASLVRLGLPDGRVVDTDVEAGLADLVPGHRLVAAPWPGEPHADHAACGRAAVSVAGRVGVDLVQGLFWTWHWLSCDEVDGSLLRLSLKDSERRRRTHAMAAHRSQTLGIGGADALLTESECEPLTWDGEYVLAAARG